MKIRLLVLLMVMSLLIGGAIALAQNTPNAIQRALADLNARLGTNLTLDTLDDWSWQENVYNDTSLGCPQPDQVYAQGVTRGYQFLLTYNDVVYDYRVSTNEITVILCSTTPLAAATTIPVTSTPLPPGVTPTFNTCQPLAGFKLAVGGAGRVTPGLNSNIRQLPDLSAPVVGQAPAGGTFTILAGPVCDANDDYWWQVQSGTVTGWIAQGLNGVFFIEPIPANLPNRTTIQPIGDGNFELMAELATIQGNISGEVAISADGNRLASINLDVTTPGAWIYDLNGLSTAAPVLYRTDSAVTALAFTPDNAYLVLGTAAGFAEFWNLSTGEQDFEIQADQTGVANIQFSADGKLMITMGDESRTIRIWGVPPGATN